jgi:hypothetical protein
MSYIRYVNKFDYMLVLGEYVIGPSDHYLAEESIPLLDSYDGILLDKYVNGVSILDTVEYNSRKVVVSSEPGAGVYMDTTNPRYGWHDLLGEIKTDRDNSANMPTFSVFAGGIKQYKFDVGDEAFINFHMPHDYAPGTDLFIHGHWSHLGDSPAGDITFGFEVSYAKGYSRESFDTSTVTLSGQASMTFAARTHQISEFQLSNEGGTGGLLDTNRIEPDGVLLVRCFLSANTSGVDPFLHYVDLHYQTTGVPTKNRSYNFWG